MGKDEIREELKQDNVMIKLSMQLAGASFSAHGPRVMVESLLASWQERAERQTKNITPNFNRMQIVSGRSK